MSPTDIYKKLGKGFRVANAPGDARSTLDADPCPHCGAPVEWAPTTHSHKGKVESYVYARCQGKTRHSWGLSSKETKVRHEAAEVESVPVMPSAGPAGAQAMNAWIDQRIKELETQIKALEEMRKLMTVIDSKQAPPPRMSPS
jgi:hypothetical protein